MADSTANGRVNREARLRWVPIPKMKINPLAQRQVNEARVDKLAAEFDPEQIGTPTVSLRDGWYYIIDGQHRIEALKRIGWGDQQVQCWCYEGLSEQDEAEKFLKLNDAVAVNAFAKYRAAITAGRPVESDIDRIVHSLDLTVSKDKGTGTIGAVGTLLRVYKRSGPATLSRSLKLIRDAYGDSGLEAPVIDGIGLLCQRYNGTLNDNEAVLRLAKAHGGVSGLLGKAEVIRRQTGNARGHCVAAAAVQIINSTKGGKKLPDWFRTAGE